jgi:precorrin-8X/cobalt-precorrin-8 methylmutase
MREIIPETHNYVAPAEIERRSFELISRELKERGIRDIDPEVEPVLKRVIHTTADFDYVENLVADAATIRTLKKELRHGASIVTDTNMAKAGINRTKLTAYGGDIYCFMGDEDVASEARMRGVTRATVSMEKASRLARPLLFVIGNAPTALVRLEELIREGRVAPVGIIAVPVGFVNVVEAKELILRTSVPHIVAKGRKGGSNVAAAIVNALLYDL